MRGKNLRGDLVYVGVGWGSPVEFKWGTTFYCPWVFILAVTSLIMVYDTLKLVKRRLKFYK